MPAAEFLRRVRTRADVEDIDPNDPLPINGGPVPPHVQSLRWVHKNVCVLYGGFVCVCVCVCVYICVCDPLTANA